MAIMRAQDAVKGSAAECFVTIGDNRYNLMTLINFESTLSFSNAQIKRLGAGMIGHKQGDAEGKWSAKGYYGTPMLKKVLYDYHQTGIFPSIEIQVTNDDKTSKFGKQTVTHKECLIDEAVLAKFDASSEYIEEDIKGTFDDWEIPEQFVIPESMK